MKHNYEVVDIPLDDGQNAGIRLLDEPYNDVVYHYDWIKLIEENLDEPTLQFEYNVLQNPNDVEEDENFHQVIGDILVGIIEEGAFKEKSS